MVIGRPSKFARRAYERELELVIEATVDGLEAGLTEERRADAIALLALLSGGVSLARAVEDPALGDEIAGAVRRAALRLGGCSTAPTQRPQQQYA